MKVSLDEMQNMTEVPSLLTPPAASGPVTRYRKILIIGPGLTFVHRGLSLKIKTA